MDRKMILSVLAIAVFGFAGTMLLIPEDRDDGVPRLPWLVSTDAQGRSQVFGFTLGVTTLAEVRDVFGEEGKINLFAHPDRPDSYTAEAYFDQIYLNRLRADFVITLEADQETLDAMYQRGLRISQLGSGDKRITLAPEDAATLGGAAIRSISYLPWKSLDAEIIERRFGNPARTLTEDTGVIHRLYPEKGMDIGLDSRGGVVIQYVNPAAFADAIAPLEAASASKAEGNVEAVPAATAPAPPQD